jgi:hypothetical protein
VGAVLSMKSAVKGRCSRGLAAVKGLKRRRMGLATAILTKRNSVVISIAQKAAKCQNGS